MPYQPGEILLDKYRIEALLGQGAFGEVYLVTHLGLKVKRAVKVLRRDAPGLGSSDFADYRARFQLEAELGARLNTPNSNPHLLQVHNYEEKDEVLLLEMEYAPGGSLAQRIQATRQQRTFLPVEAVVQMGQQVAQGLAALHALDIVHRDLKPANILFDDRGFARLADLGLAQVHGADSLRSQLSNPKPHPGTPAYMSPEQRDTFAYLPPATDVYALGLVLFEAITGRAYPSQRPGTRAGSLRPAVPAWLDELLVRMLAQLPEDRPWDGHEVASRIQGETNTPQEGPSRPVVARLPSQHEQKMPVSPGKKSHWKARLIWGFGLGVSGLGKIVLIVVLLVQSLGRRDAQAADAVYTQAADAVYTRAIETALAAQISQTIPLDPTATYQRTYTSIPTVAFAPRECRNSRVKLSYEMPKMCEY